MNDFTPYEFSSKPVVWRHPEAGEVPLGPPPPRPAFRSRLTRRGVDIVRHLAPPAGEAYVNVCRVLGLPPAPNVLE